MSGSGPSRAPFSVGSFAGGIAVLSPSGWGNLGDAAIVDSAIHAVRLRMPNAPILGLTLNPSDTVKRHAIPAFTCSGFSFGDYGVAADVTPGNESSGGDTDDDGHEEIPDPAIGQQQGRGRAALRRIALATPGVSAGWTAAKILRADVRHRHQLASATADLAFVIVAGGGQLDDFWGGTFGHPYVLWRWARRARAVGAQFLVLSVGTGTLSTPLSRLLVRSALQGARYRSFRDEGSRRLVGARFVEDDPIVPDLAYALPVESYSREQACRGPRPVVGLSPIAHCDPRVGPVRDPVRYRSYLEKLAVTALRLLETGHDLVLYGTDNADNSNVADLHREIARTAPAALLERVAIPRIATVEELFATVTKTDVILASRLHGVLLPHLVGTPVAALSYERKVSVLMKTMGCEQYCSNIDEFQPSQAYDHVTALLARRDEVSKSIAQQVAGFRQQVEAQYDRVFGVGARQP